MLVFKPISLSEWALSVASVLVLSFLFHLAELPHSRSPFVTRLVISLVIVLLYLAIVKVRVVSRKRRKDWKRSTTSFEEAGGEDPSLGNARPPADPVGYGKTMDQRTSLLRNNFRKGYIPNDLRTALFPGDEMTPQEVRRLYELNDRNDPHTIHYSVWREAHGVTEEKAQAWVEFLAGAPCDRKHDPTCKAPFKLPNDAPMTF